MQTTQLGRKNKPWVLKRLCSGSEQIRPCQSQDTLIGLTILRWRCSSLSKGCIGTGELIYFDPIGYKFHCTRRQHKSLSTKKSSSSYKMPTTYYLEQARRGEEGVGWPPELDVIPLMKQLPVPALSHWEPFSLTHSPPLSQAVFCQAVTKVCVVVVVVVVVGIDDGLVSYLFLTERFQLQVQPGTDDIRKRFGGQTRRKTKRRKGEREKKFKDVGHSIVAQQVGDTNIDILSAGKFWFLKDQV